MASVADFYAGKTILITGAAGFVGEVVLESLLRCCPGIKAIYGVLRDKKDVQAEDRKETLFKKKLFEPLLKCCPEALDKFHVISGDVSLPNLGMSDANLEIVTQEVSIVFHIAATISFHKSLQFMVRNNSMSVYYVVELCKRIKNLEVLIYTSTAGSNTNRLTKLKETIYRLPFSSTRFIDAALDGNDNELESLAAECEPKWPNAYTFSKCLAENIILDMAGDLKVALIRPLGIAGVWKSPVPGYIEDQSGITSLSIGVGKGFVKVIWGDPEVALDAIPVDVVANAHIVAGYLIATEKVPSPYVAHTVLYGKVHVSLETCSEILQDFCRRNPIPERFRQTDFRITYCPNRLHYLLMSAYHHYLPAVVMDGLLRIAGKKPRVVSMYRFLDKMMLQLNYFSSHTWALETDNFHSMDKMISEEDREIFYTDLSEFQSHELFKGIEQSAPFMDWTKEKRTPEERIKIAAMRGVLTEVIQKTTLICLAILFYYLFKFILNF